MQKAENYRPAHIEFDVTIDGSLMPENFGSFETAEDAAKFMGGNMVVINQAITVNRHMDSFEKKELRDQYNDVLENILPVNKKRLSIATQEFADAKKKLSDSQELVSANMVEVEQIAEVVKRGLKEMKLDDAMTFKVPFKGRFYIYTYIDKMVRLVAIRDIPEHEKGELFSQSASNEAFIDTQFNNEKDIADELKTKTKGPSGKASAPKGKKK